MAVTYTKHYSTRATPQREPIPGSAQVPNSAGGYAFAVDDWTRLDRFLVLGTEGGSYYASERKLTIENAEAVRRCIVADGRRTVNRIREISDSGRAPKNDPAIFALAMALKLGDLETRRLARLGVVEVCRTAPHIFKLAATVRGFGGWGRNTRAAFANWYTALSPHRLAYQIIKYPQREGWSHRDLLRMAHPRIPELEHIFRWVTRDGDLAAREVTRKDRNGNTIRIDAYESTGLEFIPLLPTFDLMLRQAKTPGRVADYIRDYGFPREAQAGGFCWAHYQQQRRRDVLRPVRAGAGAGARVSGVRVAPQAFAALVREARRLGIGVATLVARIIEAWAAAARS
jgi:hypothetical protein